jgi:DNA-binding transcriptional regulator YdaS (Cro superfamily)
MSTKESRVAALNTAIANAGGIFAFARSLGVSHQVVYQWKKLGYVPAARAIVIEHRFGVPQIDMVSESITTALRA